MPPQPLQSPFIPFPLMKPLCRQVYAASRINGLLIAAGAELTRLGRSATARNVWRFRRRRLQQRIDADAPTQQGVHGVSGFIGRALPYVATLPLGTPEIAALNALGKAGNVAQLAAAARCAEGARDAALGETRTEKIGSRECRLRRIRRRSTPWRERRCARCKASPAAGPIRILAPCRDRQQPRIPLHISQITQSTPLRTAASVAKYIPFSGADAAARNQQNAWNKALTRHVGDAT
ncbi:hypothetical protein [Xylella fastidiosa]|uniref:hypothetical protein n=1 Tax=Xylella fastidiosa TaxID=2371 RepID=UPI003AFAAE75